MDEQENQKDENIHLRRFLRVLANFMITCSLGGSGYLIYFVVKRSQEFATRTDLSWYEKNEVSQNRIMQQAFRPKMKQKDIDLMKYVWSLSTSWRLLCPCWAWCVLRCLRRSLNWRTTILESPSSGSWDASLPCFWGTSTPSCLPCLMKSTTR